MKNFLFVSAENDAIANCKAGGMADVVRDVPRQLAANGDQVHVVVPAYNRLHHNAFFISDLRIRIRGEESIAYLYEVKPKKDYSGIKHYVIHHPEIVEGNIAHIYNDDPEEPFFTDAVKYFIFNTAVAQAIKQNLFDHVDVIHLHDWHTSFLLFHKRYNLEYSLLKESWFVYSIHNLSLQGIRPLNANFASVNNFFPEIGYEYEVVKDDRYNDCINLMALGIRLADRVHTVSPSYKQDILKPSQKPEFIGGESLESDLIKADQEGRLYGILNGVNYENIRIAEKGKLYPNILRQLFKWIQEESKKYKSDILANTGEKVVCLLDNPPSFIASSVARMTEQKFYFFKRNPQAFKAILNDLAAQNGIFILLGTGEPEYEALMRDISYEHPNFIFINGQSEDIIDSIYLESDLYFMPSLFEPCGISQMLAMRNGVLCLVHHTGGLIDTVKANINGFAFDGDTIDDKINNMVLAFNNVLEVFYTDKPRWKRMCKNAKEARFSWENTVEQYYSQLYTK
ncbi:glycogen synthase [Leeuwenhoekiella aequorea]|uniref:starch synthase n=1 Tax=Leeuwenhoekiella aequorea TaxID=283736 RepID=A0A4Q0P9W3_9FLAO|nr:glycogen/starch synthase [Leeuwenhoekiella aequorea]RXG23351.1 starch synthase [Leeuwenhoekiella aequorea]